MRLKLIVLATVLGGAALVVGYLAHYSETPTRAQTITVSSPDRDRGGRMHVPVHSTSTSIPPGGTNEIFLTRRAPSSPTPADSSPPSPKWVARRPFDENAGKKPSPTTTSKYPKNMPPWFKDYDGDSDGQVAMAEWRDKKDVLSEFKKYDLNDDGYITLEELVHSG